MSETHIMILKVPALYEHYKTIVDKLNKSCYKGIYNMDESYSLKVACDNMLAAIDTLDKLQTMYVKMSDAKSDSDE